MTANTVFYIIIAILVLEFLLERGLEFLNYRWYSKPIPVDLNDIYNKAEYQKSQEYKKTNFKFSLVSSTFSFVLIMVFLYFQGFAVVNDIANNYADHPIVVALLFFAIIMLASEIISLPFSIYATFVIEEKFGFNKTTPKLFVLDKIKGYLLTAILVGGLLSLIIIFYDMAGSNFWWYVWILIFVISILINMFYARLIVPLFNKQVLLEDGDLKVKISEYAATVGFELNKIFVIDGSKRSTKANAYFSGFGKEKRVTLYDTLIEQLSQEEIVAVLAHEVGHYKKKHIIYNLIAGTLTTGFTLWLFSIFVDSSLLSNALGVSMPSFHIGLVAFGLLYAPISTVTGVLMNLLSRKFEYQADYYAKRTYNKEALISGLKTLSKTSLSNLTPHPAYVWFHYSHPSLKQRVDAMNSDVPYE